MLLLMLLFSVLLTIDASPPEPDVFVLTTGRIAVINVAKPHLPPQQFSIHDEITGIVWSMGTGTVATIDLSANVMIYPPDEQPFKIVDEGLVTVGDWSPDGRFLLLVVAEDDMPSIRAYDALEDQTITLTTLHDMAFVPYVLRWLPDGEQIYFDRGGQTLNTLTTDCLTDSDRVCRMEALYFGDGLEPESVFLPMISPNGDQWAFVCSDQQTLCIVDRETREIIMRISTGQIAVGHGAGLAPRWIGDGIYFFKDQTLYRYDLNTDTITKLFANTSSEDERQYYFWGVIEQPTSEALSQTAIFTNPIEFE